jgi:hypothetical protein
LPVEREVLTSLRSEAEIRPVVISVESLVGDVFNGANTAASIRHRLAEVFPDPTVLLTIRRQDLLLKSVYSQYINEGGIKSIEVFLQGRAPGAQGFALEAFLFDEVISELSQLFGTDHVHVMPAELLSDEGFLKDKFREVGLDIDSWDATQRSNSSLPRTGLEILRISNRLFRATSFNKNPVVPIRISAQLRHQLQRDRSLSLFRYFSGHPIALPDWAQRRIPELYSDSNRRVSEMTGIDLSSLGYP